MILRYQHPRGENKLKSMRGSLKNINKQSNVVFQETKLGDKLNINDQVEQKHKRNLFYMVACPLQSCNKTYIGEELKCMVVNVNIRT